MLNEPQKMSRQEREAAQRRQEILDAATRLFMQHGYAGTTMQMIAEEAEYSVGYLYQHFVGKKDLLEEIVDAQLRIFEDARREVRRQHQGHPLHTLRMELKRVSCQLREQAQLVPLFLHYEDTCPDRIKARLETYRHEDAQLFREAMETGEIRICDPHLTAAAFDGLTSGLIRLMAETGHLDRLHQIPGIVEDLLLRPLAKDNRDDQRKDQARP